MINWVLMGLMFAILLMIGWSFFKPNKTDDDDGEGNG